MKKLLLFLSFISVANISAMHRVQKLVGHLQKPKVQVDQETTKILAMPTNELVDFIIKKSTFKILSPDCSAILGIQNLSENKVVARFFDAINSKGGFVVVDFANNKCHKFLVDRFDFISDFCVLSAHKIAYCDLNNEIKILDLNTEKIISSLKTNYSLTRVCKVNENTLAIYSETSLQVILYDVNTNSIVNSMKVLFGSEIFALNGDKIIIKQHGTGGIYDSNLKRIGGFFPIGSGCRPFRNLVPSYRLDITIYDVKSKTTKHIPVNYWFAHLLMVNENIMLVCSMDSIKFINLQDNKIIKSILSGTVKDICNVGNQIFFVLNNRIGTFGFNQIDWANILSLRPEVIKPLLQQVLLNIEQKLDPDIISLVLQQANLLEIDKEVLDKAYNAVNETDKKIIAQRYVSQFEQFLGKKIKLTMANLLNFAPHLPKFINLDNFFENNSAVASNQSKNQVVVNLKDFQQMLQNSKEFKDSEVCEFMLKVYSKEKEEQGIGRFTFVHGRKKTLRFSSEIFKELWQMINQIKLRNDFTFLRFNQKSQIESNRKDCLFMNYALFGNCHEETMASTVSQYWLKDKSIHDKTDEFSTKKLFAKFNLDHLYQKYAKELAELEYLHNTASPYGEILLISVPEKLLHHLMCVRPGGAPLTEALKVGEVSYIMSSYVFVNTKPALTMAEILDALRKDPNSVTVDGSPYSNYLEFALPLTSSYALNPNADIKMFSFYFMDEKVKAEYEQRRDELFAKIKADYLNANIKAKL